VSYFGERELELPSSYEVPKLGPPIWHRVELTTLIWRCCASKAGLSRHLEGPKIGTVSETEQSMSNLWPAGIEVEQVGASLAVAVRD
jgi:hypothetical protein